MRPARVFSTTLLGICPSPELGTIESRRPLKGPSLPRFSQMSRPGRSAVFGSEAPQGRAHMRMQRSGSFTVSWSRVDQFAARRVASRFGAVIRNASCTRSVTTDQLIPAWRRTPIRPYSRAPRGRGGTRRGTRRTSFPAPGRLALPTQSFPSLPEARDRFFATVLADRDHSACTDP